MTYRLCTKFGLNRQHQNLRKISEEDNRDILSVFQECDSSGTGKLTREDLKVANVILFGYKPSKYEVDEMMGNDDSGSVISAMEIDRFVEVMSSKMAAQDIDENIRQTFMAFDSQCRGFLTIDDLQKVFAQITPHLSDHNILKAFREIDRDGDGRVSYADFEFMMKYSDED